MSELIKLIRLKPISNLPDVEVSNLWPLMKAFLSPILRYLMSYGVYILTLKIKRIFHACKLSFCIQSIGSSLPLTLPPSLLPSIPFFFLSFCICLSSFLVLSSTHLFIIFLERWRRNELWTWHILDKPSAPELYPSPISSCWNSGWVESAWQISKAVEHFYVIHYKKRKKNLLTFDLITNTLYHFDHLKIGNGNIYGQHVFFLGKLRNSPKYLPHWENFDWANSKSKRKWILSSYLKSKSQDALIIRSYLKVQSKTDSLMDWCE